MAAPRPWLLALPLRGGATAKSRLADAVGSEQAARLALAMGRDTVEAARAAVGPAGRIAVVTADRQVAADAARAGADVIDDPGTGLDGAAEAAAAAAERIGYAVAVLLADHPALRAADLVVALEAAGTAPGGAAFAPDAAGSGTALLCRVEPSGFTCAFGPGSAAAHERLGYTRLDLDLPRLARDVDTEADLRAAADLGVGRHTAALLAHPGPVHDLVSRAGGRAGSLQGMQASIHEFDDGEGTALLDDGRLITFSREVFQASFLRVLRPGQRVSVEVDESQSPPAATRLWMVGVGPGETIR